MQISVTARRALIVASALLAGCAGGSWAPAKPLAPQSNETHSHRPAASQCPCLYIAVGQSVLVYAAGASSTDSPIQTIEGSKTKLNGAEDIAVDANANMYVANFNLSGSKGFVTVYAAGATGNVAPIRTISGSHTELNRPFGIALNPVNGDIYVANEFGGFNNSGSVTIYASNAKGNVAPNRNHRRREHRTRRTDGTRTGR